MSFYRLMKIQLPLLAIIIILASASRIKREENQDKINQRIKGKSYCQWPTTWDELSDNDFWCAATNALFAAADFTILHHIQTNGLDDCLYIRNVYFAYSNLCIIYFVPTYWSLAIISFARIKFMKEKLISKDLITNFYKWLILWEGANYIMNEW